VTILRSVGAATPGRIPIVYLAPWIDFGGTDKNTIDWFRFIDRERFAPSLITTQPSPNRRLREVDEFAEEIWVLPDLMPAEAMPSFILDFLQSRQVAVLHLMNSRLGFDLLPDLRCLPSPPGVVVQLHVEEADRSGYVRYVTTRYGNLVDRFSVSNNHLAAAVHDYGIPEDKTKVIYIGVDAEEEFSPERVEPVAGLAEDRLHILFPARLTAQKDPLLMVEVAAALKEQGTAAQIHVLGEGDLEDEVRKRIEERGLEQEVLIHPPTPTPQRWYAACDAVLLTSVFEGIPAVVFEAMAMGLPVVTPSLPGNVELLGENYPGLVEQRDSVESYTAALAELVGATNGNGRFSGAAMRERARERFSLQRMADEHGELYEEVARVRKPAAELDPPTELPEPIRFRDRPVAATPLVSVLVPHFNQAKFIEECVDSVRAQTYPEIETIVIDDASTDADAREALDRLEAAGDVKVIRLSENGGPSHARNVGLERAGGRYVFPVDSDNILLPEAVEKLVEQLSVAGEDVGFIYPNIQFFGNREDYYEVPQYNLHTLLHGNFCDTCSLLDRQIFDAGERYSERIKLGHEDWEFALRLASRGVRGEAAWGPTMHYRKWGFNRSDMVDHSPEIFKGVLAEISPFKGQEAEIKAKESPALSIVPLRPIDLDSEVGRRVAALLEAQQCIDVELIARFDGSWPSARGVPVVRHLPTALAATEFEALHQGLETARGSFVALTAGDSGALLADPAFTAKVLRRFAAAPELGAIVLTGDGEENHFRFQPVAEDELPGSAPHTVVWRRIEEQHMPWGLQADPGDPLQSLLSLISGGGGVVEWRHWPHPAQVEPAEPAGHWAQLPASPTVAEDPYGLHPRAQPLLPGTDSYRVPRWNDTPTWVPPLSGLAIRYRERYGVRRLVTSGPPPVGYDPEHHLGALRSTGLEGTTRIVRIGEEYRAVPRGQWEKLPDDGEEIGYAEAAPLPGLDTLALAVHRATGQQMLVTLPEDPILGEVDIVEGVGFIDPFPIKPRRVPSSQRPDGLVGLLKTADQEGRRFRYSIGEFPPGEQLGELGGLAASGMQGEIPVWIVDGRLLTDRHRPPRHWFGVAQAIRWVGEPAAWRGLAPAQAQAKSILRRSAIAARRARARTSVELQPEGEPVAWLFAKARPGLKPLFAAYHPVTDDQLLAPDGEEAAQLGYLAPTLLGFMRDLGPVTGKTEQQALPVPWARRFGAVPRSW
jgi:glycosyltransferase involved in cell wall biosynthesis/GT2 family glycosyltransferase